MLLSQLAVVDEFICSGCNFFCIRKTECVLWEGQKNIHEHLLACEHYNNINDFNVDNNSFNLNQFNICQIRNRLIVKELTEIRNNLTVNNLTVKQITGRFCSLTLI